MGKYETLSHFFVKYSPQTPFGMEITFVLPDTTGLKRLFNSSGCIWIHIEGVTLVSGRDERGGVFNRKCMLICLQIGSKGLAATGRAEKAEESKMAEG